MQFISGRCLQKKKLVEGEWKVIKDHVGKHKNQVMHAKNEIYLALILDIAWWKPFILWS